MTVVAKIKNAVRVLMSENPADRTGRNLTSWVKRVGVPFVRARTIVHVWKDVRNPRAALQYRATARKYAVTGAARDVSEGFSRFNIDQIENGANVLALMQQLWRARCENGIDPAFPWADNPQTFLRNCFLPNDFIDHPELADFILNETFVQSAIQYFGAVPRLAAAELWWSPANDTFQGSQRWHFDNEDQKQFKIFMNVFDVTEANGPLTFLPASTSQKFKLKSGDRVGRISDETIASKLEGAVPLTAVGPAGDGLIIDTSRCAHMGSRTQQGNRVVLMVQYVPHNVHMESKRPPPRLDASRYSDPVRCLIANDATKARAAIYAEADDGE